MPLQPGSELAGYRVDAVVGRGGMGVVYRATELALGRPVALKLIAPELAGDERFRERFVRESRLTASLDHPSILPVYAVGEDEGQLFLATRFVDGTDLRHLLETGPLSLGRALEVAVQVASALDTAHERGLVHRDVKPANVLVDPSGHCYLCDFGLTKQTGSASTASGVMVGTLDYLAPEQIRGDPVEAPADQYALAILLYECLAGDPPFRRASEAQVLWAHVQEPPPRVSLARAGLPQELDDVLRRGLAKEPTERFPSCGALAQAARSAAGLGPSPEPSVRPRRPRRRVALAAAVVLVAAIAATAAAIFLGSADGGDVVGIPNSVVAIDPATGRVTAVISVGDTPTEITADNQAVWVLNSNEGAGTISRIDAASRRVTANFSVPGTPRTIAIADGAFWVGTTEGKVFQIDPASGVTDAVLTLRNAGKSSPFAFDTGAGWLSSGGGAVWASSLQTVSRIDPETLELDPVQSPAWGRSAFGFGSVWVIGNFFMSRLDPATGRSVARVDISTRDLPFAAGAGGVWLPDDNTRTVVRVDPRRNAVVRTIETDGRPLGVAVGAGAVWVAVDDGTVVRIDPATNQRTAIRVGGRPRSVAVGAGLVWVSVD